jgi:transposase InsO family protein
MSLALLDPPEVPIPPHWSEPIKHAYLAAFSLAHHVLFAVRSIVHYSPPYAARAELTRERLEAELALCKEQLRLVKARLAKIPAQRRPFYGNADRFAILKVKESAGWSFDRVAREFLLSADTIRNWVKALHDDSLVAPPAPVNKFPDFVEALTQQLKSVFPLLGVRAIADYLARGGVHLSVSSVRRFLARPLKKRPEPPEPARKKATRDTGHVVTAKRPGHVWHLDITTVPVSRGLALIGWPFAFPKKFPFCYSVVTVLDHFSRKVLAQKAFLQEPKASDVVCVLEHARACAGGPPGHIISDKGPQFWNHQAKEPAELYAKWLDAHDVKPRFGAIGKKGSIAIIERYFGTLKRQGTRCFLVPLLPRLMQEELDIFADWYNTIRPHQALQGRTPDEVWRLEKTASEKLRLETRERYPISKGADAEGCATTRVENLALDARCFRGRSHLPQVALRIAA